VGEVLDEKEKKEINVELVTLRTQIREAYESKEWQIVEDKSKQALGVCLKRYGKMSIFGARWAYRTGRACFMQSRFTEALNAFQSAKNMIDPKATEDLASQHELARIAFRMGDVYFSQGELEMAESQYTKSLRMAQTNKQALLEAFIHNNASLLYSIYGNYNQAAFHNIAADNIVNQTFHNGNMELLGDDTCDIAGEIDENDQKRIVVDIRREKLLPQLRSVVAVNKARIAFQRGYVNEAKEQFFALKDDNKLEPPLRLYCSVYLMAIEVMLGKFIEAQQRLTEADELKKRIELEEQVKSNWPLNLVIATLKYHDHAINLQNIQNILFDSSIVDKAIKQTKSFAQFEVFADEYCSRIRFANIVILMEQSSFNKACTQYEQFFTKINRKWSGKEWNIMTGRLYTGLKHYHSRNYEEALLCFKLTESKLMEMGCIESHYEVQKVKILILDCHIKKHDKIDHSLFRSLDTHTVQYPLLRLKYLQLVETYFIRHKKSTTTNLRKDGWQGMDITLPNWKKTAIFFCAKIKSVLQGNKR
jgi:tetratricopeptide (TPR) repeat protein